MTHNPENIAFPEITDPLDLIPADDSKSLITSGTGRSQTAFEHAQQTHTGIESIALEPTEEQALADRIFAGGIALTIIRRTDPDTFGEITDLGVASRIDPESLPEDLRPHLEIIADALEARNVLVESSMRFATHRSRMSMNIINPAKPIEDFATTEKPFNTSTKAKKPAGWERTTTFTDITKLRSEHAVYDDRVQRSMLGLIDAAEKFLPHDVRIMKAIEEAKSKKELNAVQNIRVAKFLTHAAYHIDKLLYRESLTEEGSVLQVPGYRIADISRARRSPEEFEEEKRAELLEMGELRKPMTFDDINLGIIAPEEVTSDWDEPQPLPLADLVADYRPGNSTEVHEVTAARSEVIDEVLGTLNSPYEGRSEDVIRMRFGLPSRSDPTYGTYDQPRTLDEIGIVFGVSRERIRQIESKTMSKLRHPQRSEVLRDFAEYNATEVDRQYPYHQLGELPDEFAQLRTSGLNRISEDVWHFSPAIRFGRAGLESWQVSKNEPWDMEEVREVIPDYEEVARRLNVALWYPRTSEFIRRSGPEHYPAETLAAITGETKRFLTAGHVEQYWNERLPQFVRHLDKLTDGKTNMNTVSLLFSKLLAETMTDEDTVRLIIPAELDGDLNFVGTGLTNGNLEVHGNLGDYVGYGMKDLANMTVVGNVGDRAANYMEGMATLTIDGDAGKYFGYKTTGENSLSVSGRIESFSIPPTFEGEIYAGGIDTRVPIHPRLRAKLAQSKKK